jgi:hypothetical protein
MVRFWGGENQRWTGRPQERGLSAWGAMSSAHQPLSFRNMACAPGADRDGSRGSRGEFVDRGGGTGERLGGAAAGRSGSGSVSYRLHGVTTLFAALDIALARPSPSVARTTSVRISRLSEIQLYQYAHRSRHPPRVRQRRRTEHPKVKNRLPVRPRFILHAALPY